MFKLTKACSKCGEEKLVEMFHFSKLALDGRTHICKKCKNLISAKYYAKNRESVLLGAKEHYAKNRERIKSRNRDWYAKNTQRWIVTVQKWKDKNPGRSLLYWIIKSKKQRINISDAYVRSNLLRMSGAPAPPELIELKRVQLQITRALREINK